GCSCGSKLFFYIRKEKYERLQQRETVALNTEERQQIEKDIYDLMGDIDKDVPVVLDIESINVLKPGKFELDLIQLFDKKKPLVYKLEEGKYRIDLTHSFRERLKK
ncbi:MAG: Zn-ribbon containing protein, partial [Candidatus Woesearchaeota archaeon]